MNRRSPPESDQPTAAGSRAVWALQTFVVLMAVWLALNGLTAWWLGAAFAALGGLAGSTLAIGDPYPWRPLRLIAFFGYFVRASILGGVDVAVRALHPRLPIRPHLLRRELAVPPGQPRTLLLSLVSLLPGTLSVELQRDTLVVHALSEQSAAGLDDLEPRIQWLFSLEERT